MSKSDLSSRTAQVCSQSQINTKIVGGTSREMEKTHTLFGCVTVKKRELENNRKKNKDKPFSFCGLISADIKVLYSMSEEVFLITWDDEVTGLIWSGSQSCWQNNDTHAGLQPAAHKTTGMTMMMASLAGWSTRPDQHTFLWPVKSQSPWPPPPPFFLHTP